MRRWRFNVFLKHAKLGWDILNSGRVTPPPTYSLEKNEGWQSDILVLKMRLCSLASPSHAPERLVSLCAHLHAHSLITERSTVAALCAPVRGGVVAVAAEQGRRAGKQLWPAKRLSDHKMKSTIHLPILISLCSTPEIHFFSCQGTACTFLSDITYCCSVTLWIVSSVRGVSHSYSASTQP